MWLGLRVMTVWERIILRPFLLIKLVCRGVFFSGYVVLLLLPSGRPIETAGLAGSFLIMPVERGSATVAISSGPIVVVAISGGSIVVMVFPGRSVIFVVASGRLVISSLLAVGV